jgi:ParB family transcriptional regulator, chromosome partitioning protein
MKAQVATSTTHNPETVSPLETNFGNDQHVVTVPYSGLRPSPLNEGALDLLYEQKHIAADYAVPVRIVSEGEALAAQTIPSPLQRGEAGGRPVSLPPAAHLNLRTRHS